MQAYSADQRLRIGNDSNAEVMSQVVYRDDNSVDTEWIAEALRFLSAGKCTDVALSSTAEQGYIEVMIRRRSDGQAWAFPAYASRKQDSGEVVALNRSVWFRPTETRVCIPQDITPNLNGAPPPPRKRTLRTSVAQLDNGVCARGNVVAMNLQFSLPAANTATLYISESGFRFLSN
jgi:hypothetical protein